MRVLMLSNDPEICVCKADLPAGHPRMRHRAYAEELRRQAGADSRLTVFVSVPRNVGSRPQHDEAGLTVIPVPAPHRFLSPLAHVMPVLRAAYRFRPHLITAQSPWESGPLALLAGRLCGASVLLQLHGDIGTPEWDAQGLSFRLRSWITRHLCRMADGIRVVTSRMKHRLSETWNIPADRFFVVPVPVTLPAPCELTPEQAKHALQPGLEHHPTVLFVGRLYAPKNLALWIDTAALIAAQRPDVRFIIAGDGPERDAVRSRLARHGLLDRTILPGHVARNLLPSLYKAGDVFLLTSSHEAYGMVVVESLLSGVPVVSTATSGPSEILEDGITGILAPLGEAEQLASDVIELLADDEQRRAFGKAGTHRMQLRFAPENVTKRMIEVWLICRRGGNNSWFLAILRG